MPASAALISFEIQKEKQVLYQRAPFYTGIHVSIFTFWTFNIASFGICMLRYRLILHDNLGVPVSPHSLLTSAVNVRINCNKNVVVLVLNYNTGLTVIDWFSL